MRVVIGRSSARALLFVGGVALVALTLATACFGGTGSTTTATKSVATAVASPQQEPTKSIGLVLPEATKEGTTTAALESGEAATGGEGPVHDDPMDPNVRLTLPNGISQAEMDDWMNYHDMALATKEQCNMAYGAEATQIGPGDEAFDVFPFELSEGEALWIFCGLPGFFLDAPISDSQVNPLFEESMTVEDLQRLPEGSHACFMSYNPKRAERGFRVMPAEILQMDGDVIRYVAQGEERSNDAPSMGLQSSEYFGPGRAGWSPYSFVLPDCSLA